MSAFLRLLLLPAVSSFVLACATGTPDPYMYGDGGPTDGAKTEGGGLPDIGGGGKDTGGGDKDTGTVEDTDVSDVEPTPVDAPTYSGESVFGAKPPGAGTSYDDTVGTSCTDDTTCDVTGLGTTLCAATAFTAGALYSPPVCIGVECTITDPTKIYGCDGINGVCLASGTSNICLPACSFDGSSGDKPSGCIGKNVCNAYGWGNSATTGKLIGVGYCFGGCWGDADCPTGQRCQREEGLCRKSVYVYTKALGAACTKADADANACNCLYTTATGKGYCSRQCKFGEIGWCPSGYTCDPALPKDDGAGKTLFTKVPAGIAGYCLKNCTTDLDCVNGYCKENAGTGKKTCQVGTP
ncbi:MAG: hypothetical protein HYV09_21220 [Deltaproteobacteria bacterium]|nr:hypothetical protein [Deltaproteobacteria bacterium]